MKKITVNSRYKVYIRGEFVREVEYSFDTPAEADDFGSRTATEALLEQSNRDRTAAEAAFEELVDAACE